jgi:hypothetical protein
MQALPLPFSLGATQFAPCVSNGDRRDPVAEDRHGGSSTANSSTSSDPVRRRERGSDVVTDPSGARTLT